MSRNGDKAREHGGGKKGGEKRNERGRWEIKTQEKRKMKNEKRIGGQKKRGRELKR